MRLSDRLGVLGLVLVVAASDVLGVLPAEASGETANASFSGSSVTVTWSGWAAGSAPTWQLLDTQAGQVWFTHGQTFSAGGCGGTEAAGSCTVALDSAYAGLPVVAMLCNASFSLCINGQNQVLDFGTYPTWGVASWESAWTAGTVPSSAYVVGSGGSGGGGPVTFDGIATPVLGQVPSMFGGLVAVALLCLVACLALGVGKTAAVQVGNVAASGEGVDYWLPKGERATGLAASDKAPAAARPRRQRRMGGHG